MARILFVSLFDEWATALRYLASSVLAAGHDATILFLEVFDSIRISPSKGADEDLAFPYPCPVSRRDMELMVEEIRRFDPDVVGMTVMSNLFTLAATVTEHIHRELCLPVVWGGSDPTASVPLCQPHADMICVGEGEEAMVELASRIDALRARSGGDRWKILESIEQPVRNLWIRQGDRWLHGEVGVVVEDLDALPFPLFDAEREVYVFKGKAYRGEYPAPCRLPRSIPFVCSRGCPCQCSFCCHSVQRKIYKGRYLRRRTPENVIEELRLRKQVFPELRLMEVYDAVFTVSETWIDRFADLYERHIGIPFWIFSYPGMGKESVMRRLQQIGLQSVCFGIQSGSERVLRDVYNRPTPRGKIFETAGILHRLGIPYSVDIIGSNPFETDADRLETMALLTELPKPYFLRRISPLLFFPQYDITERAREAGLPLVEGQGSYMVAAPSNRYRAWDALMTLAQFPGARAEPLAALSKNEELMDHPEPLVELARQMTVLNYCIGNVYEREEGEFEQMIQLTKDQKIRELERELATLKGSRLVRSALKVRDIVR